MQDFHFFASNVATWVTTTDQRTLPQVIELMESEGYIYSLFLVPGHWDSNYEIIISSDISLLVTVAFHTCDSTDTRTHDVDKEMMWFGLFKRLFVTFVTFVTFVMFSMLLPRSFN